MGEISVEPVEKVNEEISRYERMVHVGGLPQKTLKSDIKEYFSQFGEIENCYCDYNVGLFAVITFKDLNGLSAVLAQEQHVLKNKLVTCRTHEPREERTVYVMGLPQGAKMSNVKEYFGQFGEIELVKLFYNSRTFHWSAHIIFMYKESTV